MPIIYFTFLEVLTTSLLNATKYVSLSPPFSIPCDLVVPFPLSLFASPTAINPNLYSVSPYISISSPHLPKIQSLDLFPSQIHIFSKTHFHQMASFSSTTVLLLVIFFLFLSFSIPTQSENIEKLASRKNLGLTDEEEPISKHTPTKKKIPTTSDSKNQTKPLNPKKLKSNSTTTLILTPKSKSNKTQSLPVIKSPKSSNSTKLEKTTKPSNSTDISIAKYNNSTSKTQQQKPKPEKLESESVNPASIWLDDPSEDEDLIAEFRDLPTRIHQALLPDLRKISVTSKAYIYRANKEISGAVKPFVGKNFAPKIALAASCIFIVLPLCLVIFLFHHLNSYLSLQRFLILAQAYLAIYFLTLAVTAVVTGLEPLRFFYATSPSSYAWTQAVQTLGYVLYLLVQLINLVVVFSAGDGRIGDKALGLAQMIVGLAVGLHYYAAVFHRAVTGDPPRANWKVHAVYAAGFLLICALARAERRKKEYDGAEDVKKN